MISKSDWFKQTPTWIWWSFFPGFGGLAIAYAGHKASTSKWIVLGIGITLGGLVLSSTHLSILIWVGQVVTAFYLKKTYLLKTCPQNLLIPEDAETAKLIANFRGKVEINSCSKNDLVNVLGLPIVYANDIESLQNEGYIFTHLEELAEIVGIPGHHLQRIAPMVVFSYDQRKEAQFSWKKINILSAQELVGCGLEPAIATKIVAERQRQGEYKSVLDVKRRTGIPFNSYSRIV